MSLRRSNLQPVIATLFIGSLLILVLHGQIAAQIDVAPKRGVYLTGSYSASGFETINNTNGNVMFNLPLASLPGGRGGMSYGISLSYNSKLFDLTTNQFFVPPPGYPGLVMMAKKSETAGWQYGVGYKLEQKKRPVVPEFHNNSPEICHSPAQPDYKYFDMYKFVLTMPDGSQKEFMPVLDFGQGIYDSLNQDGYHSVDINGKYRRWSDLYVLGDWHGCEINYYQHTGGMAFYSTDGSQLRLDVAHDSDSDWTNNAWTLKLPDGSRITQAAPLPNENNGRQRIYDRNNNYVEIQKPNGTASSEIVQVTDQLGRSLIINKNLQTFEDIVTVKGVNNADLNWTVKWKNIGVSREYWMSEDRTTVPQPSVAGGIFKVIDEIILPPQLGGQSYKFDYNGNPNGDVNTTSHGFGEISRVEFPSGAVTEYEYKLDGVPPDIPEWTDVFLNSIASKKLTYQGEYDGQTSPQEEDWTYVITRTQATITAPDGGVSYSYHNDWFEDVGAYTTFGVGGGVAGNSVSPDGSISLRKYIGMNNSIFFSPVPIPTSLVGSEFTAIADSSGVPSLAAIKTYNYDLNGNLLRVKEYDWVPYSSITYSNGQIVVPTGATLKRITENTYYNPTPEYDPNLGFNQGANQPNAYYKRSSARTLSALKSTEIKTGAGTQVSRSEFVYDDLVTKGNLIESKVWDSFKNGTNQPYSNPLTGSNSISSTVQYDQYGNPVLTTDAKGVQTQITYGDIVGPNGTVNGLYPTQTEAAYGTPVARTSTAVYDFYTGLVTSATDVDNGVTAATEYDALGRPLKSIAAKDTPLEVWTRTEYDDINRRVIVRSDLFTKGDGKKIGIQHYDQLGRVRLSRSIENAATEDPYNEADGIKVQTRYLTGNPNSYQLVSNPYRAATATAATGEQSMGWTRSKGWNTGRKQEVETFSGASLPAPWGTNSNSTGVVTTDIDANSTTVTDQAGKQRRSITNALGQLTRIDEPNNAGQLGTVASPNQPTSYAYDTLNNLTTVTQGVQTRTFSYSSLSRLLSATNPESGTIIYAYDSNGNLTQKIDARNITTAYTYDVLNRVTLRDYSDTTPDVSYSYDDSQIPFSKGKLTKVSNSIFETNYNSFDILGRVLSSQQITDGQTYNSAYTYNLSGALIEQTYPSGRVVKNVLDNEGDLSIVQSKKTVNHGYWNYAENFTYAATGAVTSMQLGNGRWESTQFNSRLQPTQIALGTVQNGTDKLKLDYSYGSNTNNGNIVSQQITVPTVGSNLGFVATQAYNYDSLNRLAQGTETVPGQSGWNQTFTYDRYGNRNFNEATTTTLPKNCGTPPNQTVCPELVPIVNPMANPANNRLNGYTFDSAGNITTDAENRTFIYDAENKQVEVRDSRDNIVGQYQYDGDGKRIKKIVPNGETVIFVYDAVGKLVAEYANQISQTPQVSYLTSDNLGSPRINTDTNGATISRHDYNPFGEEIVGTGGRTVGLGYAADDIRKKFTGYERDTETELDFGQARYYSPVIGRYYSADPQNAGAVVINPQTWNAFAYVGNNPIKTTDPSGLDWYFNSEQNEYKWFEDKDDKPKGWTRVVGNNGERGSFSYQTADGTWVALDPYSSAFQDRIVDKDDAIKLASRLYQYSPEKRAFAAGYNKNYDRNMTIVTALGAAAGIVIAAPVIGLSGAGTATLGLTRVAAAAPTGVAALTQLLNSVPRWEQLKDKMQGVISGNGAQTFQQITQGATKLHENVYKLSDGRVVTYYPSSTNGVMTIQVQSGIKVVVRFTEK